MQLSAGGHGTTRPDAVLDFWFGAPDSPERGRSRKAWFTKSESFDQLIRDGYGAAALAARRGELDHWARTPLAGLALLILLDQFPRNLYRGSAEAFASDARALAVARSMVAQGFDRVLRPVERLFVYLPFEHSEDLAVQRTSVALFEALARDGQDNVDYAHRHYDFILRFGRFPHRNAALGRASTPEELAFLAQPGSSF